MPKIKSPLLASTIDGSSDESVAEHLNKLNSWPLLVSAKLDGVRALVIELDGKPVLVSRSMKPIPNTYCQKLFAKTEFIGYDGELIVGKPIDANVFQNTQSGVMSKEGSPDVKYFVFDRFDMLESAYNKRYANLAPKCFSSCNIIITEQRLAMSIGSILAYEEKCLNQGYEGIMIRSPSALYKYGRATPKEDRLMKLKRFFDSEATIIGYEELMHNENTPVTTMGPTVRPTNKENMVPGNVLGAVIAMDNITNLVFRIGSGFSMAERESLWNERDTLVGKVVTYKSFPVGVKEKPRFPIFKGFRTI